VRRDIGRGHRWDSQLEATFVKATENNRGLEEAAEEIFELTKMNWLAIGRHKRQKGEIDLTESEFLALDRLTRSHPQPLNVGEIQRHIGVLPAQMSRIIRSLESKAGKPLIRCRINPSDKRKINVTLTETGRDAHKAFRDTRLASTIELVTELPPADRVELMRIIRQFKTTIRKRLSQ
jgi:DNA-binding MarR family transcriptional regulator